MTAKYCVGCGSEIIETTEICPKCGTRVGPKPGSKNKTTAFLLALLLGGLGAHKFYFGQVGMGLLYILFCWTLVPAIIALIEAIMIISMSDEDFAAKYH